ncbi:unnamed protein product [Rotaria magnacalcarata]|uniref:Complement component 1 Q subcomponent-binding protein, mitochondrial n=2 Tax=Rotaria magnacalcarata TaxID=392030 RepID=A0A816G9Z2_9BILA|nr:unnamed protein product [Rotaria magnacalcarata]CAF1671107.1 unnamed protein product [Rotaria magnacalcarata]CAF2138958.1 unnamed protein product [Rotaria magnacalcarata]CAF4067611.1 unnamed protein product [Rotaria magnacalcarata]
MSLRNLTRGLFQLAMHRRFYSSIQQQVFTRKLVVNNQRFTSVRSFSSIQTNENVYKDLNQFLDKEIQLERVTQKHPSNLPAIQGFEVTTEGPEVTLIRQSGKEKITVKFNVTNTVNATDSDDEANLHAPDRQQSDAEVTQPSSQLKSRPTFTVDFNRGGQTLSFLCSYLPHDYSDVPEQNQGGENQPQPGENENGKLEDFQIDEFAIHEGDWNDSVYSADCAVIDGELYDKLLNLLEEHGIGEDFANQLIDFSTAYEHRQYIGLLEKLQKFSKK